MSLNSLNSKIEKVRRMLFEKPEGFLILRTLSYKDIFALFPYLCDYFDKHEIIDKYKTSTELFKVWVRYILHPQLNTLIQKHRSRGSFLGEFFCLRRSPSLNLHGELSLCKYTVWNTPQRKLKGWVSSIHFYVSKSRNKIRFEISQEVSSYLLPSSFFLKETKHFSFYQMENLNSLRNKIEPQVLGQADLVLSSY